MFFDYISFSELNVKFLLLFPGHEDPAPAQGSGEASDAVHAVQQEGVGAGEGHQHRGQAVGGRQDHRVDVARAARG